MLTTTQMATRIGITRTRVAQYIEAKRFHPMPIRAGKFWLFTGDEKIELKKQGRPKK